MQQKSTFVSVVAWLFIALSAIGFCVSIFQLVAFKVMLAEQLANIQAQGQQLAIQAFSQSFQQFVMVLIVVFIVFLVASIGLLKRKNWGRWIFIALLAMAILWQLAGLIFQYFIAEPIDPALIEQGVVSPTPDALIIGVAVTVITLSAWLIKRLLSVTIASEFK